MMVTASTREILAPLAGLPNGTWIRVTYRKDGALATAPGQLLELTAGTLRLTSLHQAEPLVLPRDAIVDVSVPSASDGPRPRPLRRSLVNGARGVALVGGTSFIAATWLEMAGWTAGSRMAVALWAGLVGLALGVLAHRLVPRARRAFHLSACTAGGACAAVALAAAGALLGFWGGKASLPPREETAVPFPPPRLVRAESLAERALRRSERLDELEAARRALGGRRMVAAAAVVALCAGAAFLPLAAWLIPCVALLGLLRWEAEGRGLVEDRRLQWLATWGASGPERPPPASGASSVRDTRGTSPPASFTATDAAGGATPRRRVAVPPETLAGEGGSARSASGKPGPSRPAPMAPGDLAAAVDRIPRGDLVETRCLGSTGTLRVAGRLQGIENGELLLLSEATARPMSVPLDRVTGVRWIASPSNRDARFGLFMAVGGTAGGAVGAIFGSVGGGYGDGEAFRLGALLGAAGGAVLGFGLAAADRWLLEPRAPERPVRDWPWDSLMRWIIDRH